MKIPKTLSEIVKYLAEINLKLSARFEDGRINATMNEDEVIKLIKKKFDIDTPKSRHWFDFSIEHNGEFYPVNIKITDTTHADNLNCKLGIYYSLTGKFPDFPNETSWLDYFQKLKDNLKETKNDYYFLVINKSDNKDIFVNSLKSLSILQPNGNNLPFQCRWEVNKKPKNRNYKESKDLILKTFGKSIKLRAEIYFIFKKLFKEYV